MASPTPQLSRSFWPTRKGQHVREAALTGRNWEPNEYDQPIYIYTHTYIYNINIPIHNIHMYTYVLCIRTPLSKSVVFRCWILWMSVFHDQHHQKSSVSWLISPEFVPPQFWIVIWGKSSQAEKCIGNMRWAGYCIDEHLWFPWSSWHKEKQKIGGAQFFWYILIPHAFRAYFGISWQPICWITFWAIG